MSTHPEATGPRPRGAAYHSYLADRWWRSLPGVLPLLLMVASLFAPPGAGIVVGLALFALIAVILPVAVCDMVDVAMGAAHGVTVRWAVVNIVSSGIVLSIIVCRVVAMT